MKVAFTATVLVLSLGEKNVQSGGKKGKELGGLLVSFSEVTRTALRS